MADLDVAVAISGRDDGASATANTVADSLKKVENAASESSSVLDRLWSSMGQGIAMAAGFRILDMVTSGFSAAKDAAMGFNQTLDGARAMMGKYFDSTESLNNSIADLNTLAAKTPFAFEGLLTAQQRTISAAQSADQLKENMEAIAVVAANTGRVSTENFDRISLALGQVQTKGHLAGGELKQLQEAGVRTDDIFAIMASQMGTTSTAIQQMVTDGKISSQDLFAAMRAYAADPKNREALNGLMNTWAGAWSTISDVGKMAIAEAFRPFYDLLTQGAIAVANFLQTDNFQVWLQVVTNVFAAISTAITNLLSMLAPLGQTIATAFDQLTHADFSGAFDTLLGGAESVFGQIVTWVYGLIGDMGDAGSGMVGQFAAGMLAAAQSGLAGVMGFISDMIGAVFGTSSGGGAVADMVSNMTQAMGVSNKVVGDTATAAATTTVAATKQAAGAADALKAQTRDVSDQIRALQDQTRDTEDDIKRVTSEMEAIKKSNADQIAGIKEGAETVKRAYTDQIAGVKDQIDSIKDSHEAAIKAIQGQIDGIKDSYAATIDAVKQQIDTIKDHYQDVERAAQDAIEATKAKYQDQIETAKAKIDSLKDSYEQQQQDVQAQIEATKDHYSAAIDAIKDKIESMKQSYADQEAALQKIIDKTKTDYASAIDAVQQKISDTKDSYSDQENALQRIIDAMKDRYGAAIDDVQAKIAATKQSYADQESALQKIIDTTKSSYANAIAGVQAQIDATKKSYQDQQAAVQAIIDTTKNQYATALGAVQDQLDAIKAQETASLTPLQSQLDLIQNANKYLREQQDATKAINDAKLQQLQLDALGDPAQRAALSGQLAAIGQQQQQVQLAQDLADAQTKLGGSGLSDLDKQALTLKVQQLETQQKLANLVDTSKLQEATRQQTLNDATQKQLDITNAISDANDKLLAIPIEQKIESIKTAAEAALSPLNDQLDLLKKQEAAVLDPLQDQLAALGKASAAALSPLQDELANLQAQQKTTMDALDLQMAALKDAAEAALRPLTDQLTGLQTEEKTALDPLQDQLKLLKQQEQDALDPLNDQLKLLQQQSKAALDPLTAQMSTLKEQADAAMRPLNDQLRSTEAAQKAALDPLQDKLKAIKLEEQDALKPLQDRVKQLQLDQEHALKPLQQHLVDIKREEQDTLAPLQQQLKDLDRAQKAALDPLQDKIKAIKAEQDAETGLLEDRVKSLQRANETANRAAEDQIRGIQDAQKAALRPLQDQLDAYKAQKDELQDQAHALQDIKAQLTEQGQIARENAKIKPDLPSVGPLHVDKTPEQAALADRVKAQAEAIGKVFTDTFGGWIVAHFWAPVIALMASGSSGGVTAVLAAVAGYLEAAAPRIGAVALKWADAYMSWITEAWHSGLNMLAELLQSVYTWIDANAAPIANRFISWEFAFAAWVAAAAADLVPKLADLLGDMLSWIGNQTIILSAKLLEWATAYVKWVAPLIPQMLTELGKYLSQMIEWLGSKTGDILDALGKWALEFVNWVGPKVGPLLIELGKLLISLTGWILGTALPAIVLKLGDWATAIVDWVAPRIVPLLLELGKLLLAVTVWLVTEGLPAIIKELAKWAGAFIEWIAPMIVSLGLELAKIGTAIVTWIGKQVQPGSPDALPAQLGKWTAEFLGWCADVAGSIVAKLVPILTNILLWIGTTSATLVTELLKLGVTFGTSIYDGINQYWTQNLSPWLQAFGDAMLAAFGWAGGVLTWLDTLKTIGTSILTGIWNGLDAYWTSNLQPWWTSLITNIYTAFGWANGALTFSTTLSDIGKAILRGLWNGLTAFWNGDGGESLSQWWIDLKGLIFTNLGWVGGALAWAEDLKSAGKAILRNLWNGLTAFWQGDGGESLSQWFKDLGGLIMTALGWSGGALTWVENLKSAGKAILQGLQDGFSNAIQGFFDFLKNDLIDKIPEAIRKLLHLDQDTGEMALVGERMVEELKIGVKNAWPSLQDLLKNLGGNLKGNDLIRQIQSLATDMGGDDFGRAAASISAAETSGGTNLSEIGGTGAKGPFQFDPGGKLQDYAQYLHMSMRDAGDYSIQNPLEAAKWALEGYLGDAINQGIARHKSGVDLAVYGEKYGEAPYEPKDNPEEPYDRVRQWYSSLYGLKDGAIVKGGSGGIIAHVGEGKHDELVTPLPSGGRSMWPSAVEIGAAVADALPPMISIGSVGSDEAVQAIRRETVRQNYLKKQRGYR